MNESDIEKMLDELVMRYGKTQKLYFGGGSIVMLGLSVVLNIYAFAPSTVFLNANLPIVLEEFVRIVIVFLLLELIILGLILFDNHKFRKMSLSDKREYLYNNVKEKSSKMCPSCGLFFDNAEIKCSKCGGDLAMSYEYMWVEDSLNV